MFSARVPAGLTPNRITAALRSLRAAGEPLVDLTASNPTTAGFLYPPDLLAGLGGPDALTYTPDPQGLDRKSTRLNSSHT